MTGALRDRTPPAAPPASWLPARPVFAPVEFRTPQLRAPIPAPAPQPEPQPQPPQQLQAFLVQPPAHVQPRAATTNPFSRGDGMFGITVGIVAVIVLAAAAVAMMQSMHGWPPH